eukprot:TRINITY_DN15827_c0_g1_i1.p1 TRINITY_DN15827_c0_g1~~TRINITY_DN15827_c0_g1_i1.p1  ORF type:complete len:349 (-),score=33.77 TRINITY_DN15827_c0_g1_i1:67-1113(-)
MTPYHVRAHYNRTTIWEQRREWEKAISDYNAILSINPKISEAYLFRSKSYLQMGNIKKAIEDCRVTVTHKKSYVPALSYYLRLLFNETHIAQILEESTSLIEDIKIALKDAEDEVDDNNLNPDPDSVIHDITTRILSQKVKQVRLALSLVYQLRAEIYFFKGNFLQAKEDYKSLVQYGLSSDKYPFLVYVEQYNWNSVSANIISLTNHMLYHCKSITDIKSLLREIRHSENASFYILHTLEEKLFFGAFYAYKHWELHVYPNVFSSAFFNHIEMNISSSVWKGFIEATSYPWLISLLFDANITAHHIYSNKDLFEEMNLLLQKFSSDRNKFVQAIEDLVTDILQWTPF